MEIPENLAKFLATFIQTLKSESIEWEKKYQPEKIKLKEERAVGELRIKQKLEEMEIEFKEVRVGVQMKENLRTRNFEEYLGSLDELRSQILERYVGMPKPVALMIHNHATDLLIEAWHNPDDSKRSERHRKFQELMITVTRELAQVQGSGQVQMLPEKTLELIRRDA